MAAPMKKTVELFYDVVSPYTWFAFEVLCRYKNVWNIDLRLKPFFLGGVMNESEIVTKQQHAICCDRCNNLQRRKCKKGWHRRINTRAGRSDLGNRPPAMVPNKGKYLNQDIQMLAKYFKVPLVPPKDPAEVMFVKGSLPAQRFITAVDLLDNTKVEATSRELWLRIWSRDEDIVDPESLLQAGKKAGLSDEQVKICLQRMKEQPVKDRLKQYTGEALEYGAFGSPTIIAHVGKPVMVFGSDRFPILAQILNERWDGPTPGSKL